MNSNSDNLEQNELIPVGKILSSYALKGEFIIKPYHNNAEESVLLKAKLLYIINKRAKQPLEISNINITKSKIYKNGILILSQEFRVPEALKPYMGCEVAIAREHFPKAEEDEFYWIDLINKKVINKQGQLLGVVNRMMDNGVQSILCIHPQPDTKLADEILIPFTASYIVKVEEYITADWEI